MSDNVEETTLNAPSRRVKLVVRRPFPVPMTQRQSLKSRLKERYSYEPPNISEPIFNSNPNNLYNDSNNNNDNKETVILNSNSNNNNHNNETNENENFKNREFNYEFYELTSDEEEEESKNQSKNPSKNQSKSQINSSISNNLNPSAKKKKPKKKNVSKSRKESYEVYIHKVLKQVHPNLHISNKAISIVNSMMNDVFERLASEASFVLIYNNKKTLSQREIKTAVRLMFPGQLATQAFLEGKRATYKYNISKTFTSTQ